MQPAAVEDVDYRSPRGLDRTLFQKLILDDCDVEPLDPQARHDLLEILEERYGLRSAIVTSQLPVDKWHDAIGDPDLRRRHSSTASSTTPIASIPPATPCAANARQKPASDD